eukprot:CCRYP_014554-RA/>CCRYP_014554-RA protein AED:0.35 eAED:0.35 QI:0/-1/0/1/-1/1/1/0/179
MATSKLFLIPFLLFAIVLLGWGTSLLSFNEPSLASLQKQILNLQRDLRGFDKMKEEYVREEIEIIWDKQHLLELNDQQSELNTNLSHLTESFKQEASALRDNRHQMDRALSALHDSNDQMRSQDMEVLRRLDEESGKAHEKMHEEHQEHVVLEDILGEMRQLLDIQRSGLRGAPKSADS